MRCFKYFFITKPKEKKLVYRLLCFKRISRHEKSQEILVKRAYNIAIIFLHVFDITNQLCQVNK